jgi:hypothetical protein
MTITLAEFCERYMWPAVLAAAIQREKEQEMMKVYPDDGLAYLGIKSVEQCRDDAEADSLAEASRREARSKAAEDKLAALYGEDSKDPGKLKSAALRRAQDVAAAYDQGETVPAIAARLGVSKNRVYELIRRGKGGESLRRL